MQVGGLAERYAKALVKLEIPGLSLVALQQEISTIAGIYTTSDDFRQVLENPSFSIEERKAVIDAVVKRAGASRTTRNALHLLCDKERTGILPDLARALERYTDNQSGIVRAHVKAASALKPAQTAALTKALSEIQSKPVKLTSEVRPELLGGVVVEMDGKVYDGSVRKRLHTIRESILKDVQ